MLKRKINAVLSLLTTVLLLVHAITCSIFMLSGDRVARPPELMSWVLMGLLIIHALISIDLVIASHAETDNRKGKKYPKLNAAMIVQRASGVLMVPATGLHIAGAIGLMVPPKAVHLIVPPLFFTMVLVHVAVSTSKALITLGIGNAKMMKVVNIVMRVVCGATLIAGVVGIYLRTFAGVAA